jgi:hypothetical protein
MPHGQLAKLAKLVSKLPSYGRMSMVSLHVIMPQAADHSNSPGECAYMRVENGSAQIIVSLQAYVGSGGLQGRVCVFTIFEASYILEKLRTKCARACSESSVFQKCVSH